MPEIRTEQEQIEANTLLFRERLNGVALIIKPPQLTDITEICKKRGGPAVVITPDAVAMMKQQMGALQKVYDLLLERTGIRIAEVERLLY